MLASDAVVSELLTVNFLAARAENKRGELPMHNAAEHDTSPFVMAALIMAGPDAPKAKAQDGALPLHRASSTADAPPSRRAPTMVQRSPSISELSIEVGAIQKPSLKRRASTPGTPESPGAPPSSTVIGEPEWYRRVCLHPHSKPRIAWDLCSMTFLL